MIIIGILFLVKPVLFKKRFSKKVTKKLKKALFLITLTLSFSLIGISFKVQGLLPKILMVFGILGIFKAFFFIKSKSADKLIEWIGKQSLNLFRLIALAYIAMGTVIVNF